WSCCNPSIFDAIDHDPRPDRGEAVCKAVWVVRPMSEAGRAGCEYVGEEFVGHRDERAGAQHLLVGREAAGNIGGDDQRPAMIHLVMPMAEIGAIARKGRLRG